MKKTALTPEQLKKLSEGLKVAKEKTGFWSPQKAGEKIFGVVISITEVKNKKGSKNMKSKVCHLQTSDGEKAFYLKSVLESRFEELNVKVNDAIAVEYLGAKMNGKKVQYHKYAVAKL